MSYSLRKSHSAENDVHSKRFSSRCFQGHNLHPWVRSFVGVFSNINIFTSDKILNFFFDLKGIICTPKLFHKKYRSPCSFKSKHHTCLSRLSYIKTKFAMFSECVRLFAKSYGSFTTSLTCFENCFSVYDRLTPYLQHCKFDQFRNIDTAYAQYRMRSAILRNNLKKLPWYLSHDRWTKLDLQLFLIRFYTI